MADLAGLRKRRGMNKGKLTNIIKFAHEADCDVALEQLNVRLSRVENLMKEFTDIESAMLLIDANEPCDTVYEENYYNAVAKLNALIREKQLNAGNGGFILDTSQNATQIGSRSDVKLPKIQIPPFSGEYSEWQSFFDLYTTTIHECPSLNAVQKLQYLKGLLRGEAAVLLRHINVTENNYIGALNKLKERYDRKNHIINSFIRTFIEQSPIHTSNANQIKKIMDTSDEVIRGLKALGDDAESRDPWLIYILMGKLDDKSRALWAEAATDMDDPKFSDFLKFLSRRIDTLECLNVSLKRPNFKHDIRGHVSTREPIALEANVAAQKPPFQCAICQDPDHSLFECKDFHSLDAKGRVEFAKQNKRCNNCLSSKHPIFKCPSRRRCRKCGRKHHTLLHQEELMGNTVPALESITSAIAATKLSPNTHTTALLPTAMIKVLNVSGQLVSCRALLDSGSQASFITEACAQRLRIRKRNSRILISGLGQSSSLRSKGITTLTICPEFSPEFQIDALVMMKITSKLPHQNLDVGSITVGKQIKLADPYFHKRDDIDILIGADHFFNVLLDGQIKTAPTEPILQNTIFGWIVSGRVSETPDAHVASMISVTREVENLVDIDKSLRRFWELDSVDEPKSLLSSEENFCETHFQSNVKRSQEGRFIVRLPFKESPSSLGKSLPAAIQRLRGLERRFERDPDLAKSYHAFLLEYQQLHHMSEITSEEISEHGFYLPHHGVTKATGSTKKLRVVFDGSSKTSTGVSLNDCLAVGPTLQSSLFAIILRFREHKVVFSADVQKMYRQVLIHPEDAQFQKILWRTDPSKPIRHFKLNTVTYGLSSSSFLAIKATQQAAEENKTTAPLVTNVILKSMYVDDVMIGMDEQEGLLQLQTSLTAVLSQYGFQLGKWKSNCARILSNAHTDNNESHLKELEDHAQETENASKVLGVAWNAKTDRFIFTSSLPDNVKFTKRTVLSEASRIFDPLGWISPVVITTKIFLQTLWGEKLGWDDPLPYNKRVQWEKIRSNLKNIAIISIPRFIQTNKACQVDVHGFCDASQMAYAAVIFFKVTNSDGNTFVNMVASKTKVAPIKQQTLPRLELCAAVLLTRLTEVVLRETQSHFCQIFAWTDSKIVLDWLGSHPRRWNTFVGNRTATILSSIPRQHWGHVPTVENPADCATRGLSPPELMSHKLWWMGPAWLHKSPESWPPQSTYHTDIEERSKKVVAFVSSLSARNEWYDVIIAKYSSFRKLQRVLGYIFRYINNSAKVKESRLSGIYLRREELFHALCTLCHNEQIQYYHEDISSLQSTGEVTKNSGLKSLNPFVDDIGILRVGGRLQNSLAPHSTKHPIILPYKSKITSLILTDIHQDNKHAGPSLLLAIARQEFWIPNGKVKAKQIVNRCVTCSKFKAQCQQQLMGNLPRSRVELIRPFLRTGVDYAGPIQIHLIKGRGQRTYKAYVCLFICLSTKAVHLELVSDLSSDAFLGALKRFTARRGVCQELNTDNGTNFVGAEAKLNKEFATLIKNSNNLSDFFSRHRITWKFIPPSAPHFGGIWEAAIKSCKFHLKRVIGQTILTLEEINTLLAEIEGILNSRPLCRLNDTDVDPLTPSHFLLGHPTTKIPEIDLTHVKMSHLTRWQAVQQISQHFWRRWSIEYLTSLQQRSKWRFKNEPIKIGDIVTVKENNLPVNLWLLGRVINLHPGSDGIIRVVTIKTKSNEIKRPVHKLCILPVAPDTME